jgi:predicted alpha-1,2-mannosidase
VPRIPDERPGGGRRRTRTPRRYYRPCVMGGSGVAGTSGLGDRSRCSRTLRTSPAAVLALAAVALVTMASTIAGPAARASGSQPPSSAVADPAALVHPLDGTGTGPVTPGTVGEFPGADLPFGMIQWSPDTSPNAVQSGGGYSYGDHAIDGFSLTHLSGTGCPSFQDVPVLPTVGAIGPDPETTTDAFSHRDEEATPGRYDVSLQPGPISVALAVTTRTGIARFSFPASTQSNLLFKVAGSVNPVTASSVQILGRDELAGEVTSGQFCGTGTNYTLHFVALFDRPFAAAGTWTSSGVDPDTTTPDTTTPDTTTPSGSSCNGTTCGAYVTFDTSSERNVLMKVGISFVSTADAKENLRAEDGGWSLARVSASARDAWNALLGRIAVSGGTAAERHIFYTALYHSLLFPDVVSDVNGEYAGSDGKVHDARGREEYADFSEWDVYRSEIQLESLVAPRQVGNMVQSLVDDGKQGGWLPKWAIVGGDESQMNGDSADPIIADAYAMGARNFDLSTALRLMVKGATENETDHGLEIERQYLGQYLSQHYVNATSLDLTSIDYSIGGSATLEYAIDDFAIARMAEAEHDPSLAAAMMRRSANWEYEFNPGTGSVQARGTDGSFPAGPAFDPAQFEPGGQTGFEEGNAAQYTWSVPQDLAALASLMGGDAAATSKLRGFFTSLNASRYQPYDWSGNEPSEWAPWEFDWFGAPVQTQRTVRAIVDDEYADAPVDEPGNDDLGAISSWYVWGALGLFPVTPGSADLALASPLFPSVTITLPDGRHLVEDAPGAAASRPYVHALTVSGVAQPRLATAACASSSRPGPRSGMWSVPWLPASALRSGATLTYSLSRAPDSAWASSPSASPPSFGTGSSPAIGYSVPSGGVTVTEGQPASVRLGVAPATSGTVSVDWSAETGPPGVSVSPSSGVLHLPNATSSGPCGTTRNTTVPLSLTAAAAGTYPVRIQFRTTDGTALPPVVLDVTAQP